VGRTTRTCRSMCLPPEWFGFLLLWRITHYLWQNSALKPPEITGVEASLGKVSMKLKGRSFSPCPCKFFLMQTSCHEFSPQFNATEHKLWHPPTSQYDVVEKMSSIYCFRRFSGRKWLESFRCSISKKILDSSPRLIVFVFART
jgi:hypothetical protein